jgi:orotate phosphoribosyltransferase
MMDIDGVLCPDWTGGDDTGTEYENWLRTVPLKIRPKNVGALITWRREEHRGITEAWLKSKGVTYSNLIMAERDKWPSVAEYKAYYYKSSDARLFIESNSKQAKRIYELSNKPVICFLTNEAYGVEND